MTEIPFDKMEGAGNDFVFVDHRAPRVADADKARFARAACDRRFGVGADGCVFIEPDPDPAFAFAWDFYNADGSRAEMCGNAARCAARFARAHGLVDADAFAFRSLAGPIAAALTPDGARVRLTDVPAPRGMAGVEAAGRVCDAVFLNTGVPHAVVAVDDLAAVDVVGWGRALRRHVAFGPAGANVDFVARDGDGVAIRTYERGVEDETLACGTGATAAAIAAARLFGLSSPVAVRTRGGPVLTIAWAATAADGAVSGVTLSGPARRSFWGVFPWED